MPHIRHELLIAASAEKIYRAITSQEGLSGWWTPGIRTTAVQNSIARFSFGPDYFKEMKITKLEAPQQVQWICIAGADEWIDTNISFELQPGDKETLLNEHPELEGQEQQQGDSNNGTLLVFHHDDWKAYTSMFAECNYTWARFLWSLKLYCETGKGCPWPNQHRIQP